MCLKWNSEYFSLQEIDENLYDIVALEWPLGQVDIDRLILACNVCYYPIAYEEVILRKILNEHNISFGFVVPIRYLFDTIVIQNENPIEQWKTEVSCPNCGLILSFLSPHLNDLSTEDSEKITSYDDLFNQISGDQDFS